MSFAKGHTVSREVREKISKSLKGHPTSQTTRRKIGLSGLGRRSPLRGQILTDEHKRKAVQTRRRRGSYYRGEANPNWRGGLKDQLEQLRKSVEYQLWRKAVFERDNYTCIWCGDARGGNLEADHIKPFASFPELRFAVDNGRTLCKTCHKKTDTYAGRGQQRIKIKITTS